MVICYDSYLRDTEIVIEEYLKVLNQPFSVVHKFERENCRAVVCDFLCECTEQNKRKARKPCVLSVCITVYSYEEHSESVYCGMGRACFFLFSCLTLSLPN